MFWFIAGETRNRFDGESDEQYVARVLKNKRIRDRARERQRVKWLVRLDGAQTAARARLFAEGEEEPAVPESAPQDNRVADLEQECVRLSLESRNWQLRCERMEARLMRVTTAMGDLARLTAAAAIEVAEEHERDEA